MSEQGRRGFLAALGAMICGPFAAEPLPVPKPTLWPWPAMSSLAAGVSPVRGVNFTDVYPEAETTYLKFGTGPHGETIICHQNGEPCEGFEDEPDESADLIPPYGSAAWFYA